MELDAARRRGGGGAARIRRESARSSAAVVAVVVVAISAATTAGVSPPPPATVRGNGAIRPTVGLRPPTAVATTEVDDRIDGGGGGAGRRGGTRAVVVPALQVERRGRHGRVGHFRQEVMQVVAGLPVPLVAGVRPEDDEEGHGRHEHAHAVGVVQVALIFVVAIMMMTTVPGVVPMAAMFIITGIIIPPQRDEEVHDHRQEADEGSAVQGRAVDASQEVRAVYALEVVDHIITYILILLLK